MLPIISNFQTQYGDYKNIRNLGIDSHPTDDQTDAIRVILEANNNVYFPHGTYRCRNLYIKNNNQKIRIDGTIKQIDGTIHDITQDAAESTNVLYIENATSGELDFIEALIAEATDYYYYVTYYDDNYAVEGGGTGQVHKNGYTSRVTAINKTSKFITLADNIPVGGGLTTVANPKVSVLYNIFEVDGVDNIKFIGNGTLDANRANTMDVNPVWIVGPVGHPEYAGAGANFIECFNVREGLGFEVKDLTVKSGKDNIMIWKEDGNVRVQNVKSFDAHNKNIGFLINGSPTYPDINGLFESCIADGSDYEDGMLGYANADNLKYMNCIAKNCPRNGFTFNRENSNNNIAVNLTAINCGVGVGFNRGGITEVLTVRDVYIEGGGYHDKVPSYSSGVEIRSLEVSACGYINLYNLGMVCDKQTYGIMFGFAEYINLVWDKKDTKLNIITGNLSPPHAFGYFVRITSDCDNIVIDGGGYLVVEDFKYLFNIETGSSNITIKNIHFKNYTNLGTIDASATFQNNYFNGVFYATGYPLSTLINAELWLMSDTEVTGDPVSAWGDQSVNNNDASQGTGGLQPDLVPAVLDGYPSVRGDGGDDIMNLSSNILIASDFAIFAVMGGVVTPNYMWGYSSTIYARFISTDFIWRNSTIHTFDHSNKILTTGYYLHHFIRLSDQVRSYRDNVESLTGALSNDVGLNLDKIFSFGTAWGLAGLVEFVVISGTLSQAQIDEVVNYFAVKYPTLNI